MPGYIFLEIEQTHSILYLALFKQLKECQSYFLLLLLLPILILFNFFLNPFALQFIKYLRNIKKNKNTTILPKKNVNLYNVSWHTLCRDMLLTGQSQMRTGHPSAPVALLLLTWVVRKILVLPSAELNPSRASKSHENQTHACALAMQDEDYAMQIPF